jgi:hypothetical protein
MHNIKVIDNFESFPESINTPSYNQQFMSYDHCKLEVAVRNQFWIDQTNWTGLDFKATSIGNMDKL